MQSRLGAFVGLICYSVLYILCSIKVCRSAGFMCASILPLNIIRYPCHQTNLWLCKYLKSIKGFLCPCYLPYARPLHYQKSLTMVLLFFLWKALWLKYLVFWSYSLSRRLWNIVPIWYLPSLTNIIILLEPYGVHSF